MNIKGYRAHHRSFALLVSIKYLTYPEYFLYNLIIDQTDFDPRHDKHNQFVFYPHDYADFLKKNVRTIRDNFKSLINKKLIKPVNKRKKLYSIRDIRVFTLAKGFQGTAHLFPSTKKKIETSDLITAISFPNNEDKLPNYGNKVPNKDSNYLNNTQSKHLSSSKVNSGFSNSNTDIDMESIRQIEESINESFNNK